jgi:hypothetical protein
VKKQWMEACQATSRNLLGQVPVPASQVQSKQMDQNSKLCRRSWCSARSILLAPFSRALDQDIMICRSCFLVASWPQGMPHHYFQAHQITVVTHFPMQRILRNLDATSRIVEWALELSSFDLKFESTSTIQSRALVEFIAEWMLTPDEEIPETSLPGKETT